MYKLLLCWRYLRTRYIALASIISVTLGVATMIVVNSVMAGFSHEMQTRIHGILSDVVVESYSLEGFYDPARHMRRIEQVAGQHIVGMTATVTVPAMLSFEYGGQWVTRPVQLIGIDETTYSAAGDYSRYLQHPENRRQMSFELKESGYLTRDPNAGLEAAERPQLKEAGWRLRRRKAELQKIWQPPTANVGDRDNPEPTQPTPLTSPSVENPPSGRLAEFTDGTAADTGESLQGAGETVDPFARRPSKGRKFDPAVDQHTGLVLGIGLASYRMADGEERFLVVPGDDVKLTFPTAGTPPRAIDDSFTVVDLYECKMSEYDSSFVFVPIEKLQQLRGMIEPQTGTAFVTSIQIKLKDDSQGPLVRDKLRAAFPPQVYGIHTWRDKQGPLLAAVQMETAILNVLLFLIIAVAGFGILAIFFMIVVEKTRDIGILKSLGASGGGIMGIFVGYGLSLGIVGSGAGLVLGLLMVVYINELADALAVVTGHEVFDPSIYYFFQIPTSTDPLTVALIVSGALAIAVMASILPARRAARMQPVEALRYE